MRKLYVLAVTVIFALLSASAYCADNQWSWAFGASANYEMAGTGGAYGVDPAASDGYDSLDRSIVPGMRAYFGVYHENSVDNWNGPSRFYNIDRKAPMPLINGNSSNWLIYIWADPSLIQDATYVDVNCSIGHASPSNLDVWIKLMYKPESISGGPDVGTAWHLSETRGMGCRLPLYCTDNGLTGYQFELTATVIPEPASLLALASGVIGLGCFVRKRR